MSTSEQSSYIVYAERSRDELFAALQRLIQAVWGRKHSNAIMTIPVDEMRDADCILSDGINDLQRLRWKCAEQQQRIAELKAELAALRGDAARGVGVA